METPRRHPASVLQNKTDVIKKRNRNCSSLATSSRKSVPSITATGAACGIVTANPMTDDAGSISPAFHQLDLRTILLEPTPQLRRTLNSAK
jgi:hypothetical protein